MNYFKVIKSICASTILFVFHNAHCEDASIINQNVMHSSFQEILSQNAGTPVTNVGLAPQDRDVLQACVLLASFITYASYQIAINKNFDALKNDHLLSFVLGATLVKYFSMSGWRLFEDPTDRTKDAVFVLFSVAAVLQGIFERDVSLFAGLITFLVSAKISQRWGYNPADYATDWCFNAYQRWFSKPHVP